MNSKLKHRLVGASVLLALAVLILPDLLDGQKVTRERSFAVIPLQPEVKDEFRTPQEPQHLEREVAIEPAVESVEQAVEPVDEEVVNAAIPPQPVVAQLESPEQPEKRVTPVNPTDKKLPQFKDSAWVLQLGVFRNAKNVNELVIKLRKAGYPAFSKPKTAIQGEPTWVYVGPDLSKQKLLSFTPELKGLTGLNGKVYPYNPQSQ